ncbi:MAG: pentapeptide repeat-containing protein [Chloroflexi bacterium]|nr:pentapeptide repeat-containing protein [Chloroflexota bacterium]
MEHVETAGWNTYWAERGQPWRTEPEIGEDRRAELAARRAITPDVVRGEYPFKGVRLERADIEWLLATHEEGRGPVDPNDETQRDRVGLDLRGANLSRIQLSNLPLARTAGDATRPTLQELTPEQRRLAAIDLRGAHLVDAHLEGSCLDYADMGHADLRGCHLEGARLWGVSLREANCDGAHLEGADLWNAHLEGAFLYRAYVQGARMHEAYLAGVHFNELHVTDENGVGPMVADMHWEGINLSIVHWSTIRLLGDDWLALGDAVEMDQVSRIRMLKSAIRANQQLALALQAQGMTDDANRFFYRSRVLGRRLLAVHGGRRVGLYLVSLLLDVLTGYGYRMGRMVVAYVALISLFAALYYSYGQAGAPHLGWRDAAVLSITAFHGRDFSAMFTPSSPQSVVAAAEALTGFLFEGIFIAMLAQRVFGR